MVPAFYLRESRAITSTFTPLDKMVRIWKRTTTFPANDAHAVWSQDGKYILWNSGEYGFKDEAALYDNSFQPYGSIWMMNGDGTGKRQLTDSHWEDAMPCFVPGSIGSAKAGR